MFFIKNDRSFFNLISFICACIIPLLITGPFLPDLLLSTLSLWFLFYSFKKKIYVIYKNRYFLIFFAFCCACIVSSLLSENKIFSLKSSLFYIRIGIFALLILYLIEKKTNILDYFYYIFLITFSILNLDGYLQFLTGHNILGLPMHPARVSSFFNEKLILGSYLSRLFPLLLALFLTRNKKKKLEIFYFFFLFFFTDVLVFLSGERASFVFFNVSSVFIMLFISEYKKLRLFLFFLVYLFITIIIFNNKLIYERYITSVASHLKLDKQDAKFVFFSDIHDGYARTSINMFLDKPVLGHGPNSFRIKCADPRYGVGPAPCNTHPHNFYFQLAAETGIIGLSFLFGLLIFFLYLMCKYIFKNVFFKKKCLSDYKICLLAGLLITIWPLTTNGNFFNNHLMLLYSIQMGFFVKNS
jgi:O-antigen ligase